MKRRPVDRYVATMLCLLAALYTIIGAEYLRRRPTRPFPVARNFGASDGGTILATETPIDTPKLLAVYDIRDLIPPPEPPSVPAHPFPTQTRAQVTASIFLLLKQSATTTSPVFVVPASSPSVSNHVLDWSNWEDPRDYEREWADRDVSEKMVESLKLLKTVSITEERPFTIETWAHRLLVTGTPEIHQSVEDRLAQLRSNKKSPGG